MTQIEQAVLRVESEHRRGDWTEGGFVGNSIDGHECVRDGQMWPCSAQQLRLAAIRSAAPVEPTDTLEAALERERDLRAERVETAKYHVAHDGTVRHPDGCNDCRALAERSAAPVEPT